jgi:chemotaxis protein MotB
LLLLLLTGFVIQLSMSALNSATLAAGLGISVERQVAIQREAVQIARGVRKVLTEYLGPAAVAQTAELQLVFPQDVTLRIMDEGVALSLGSGGFMPGKRELSEGIRELVVRLAPALVVKHATIRIEGHTDATPIATSEFPSNWELSTARAIEVAQMLVAAGVPGERVSAVGYAETRPVASNETEQGRTENRRVELVLEPIIEEPRSL